MRTFCQHGKKLYSVIRNEIPVFLITMLLSQSVLLAQIDLRSSVVSEPGQPKRVQLIAENVSADTLDNIEIISSGMRQSTLDCSSQTVQGAIFTMAESRLDSNDSVSCELTIPNNVSRLNASFAVIGVNSEGKTVASRTSLDAILGGGTPAAQAIGSVLLGYVHVDNDSDTEFSAGDLLNFTYTVVNTGQFDFSGITLVDDLGNSIICPASALPIGESLVCTSSFSISAPAGNFVNSVDFTAMSGAGPVADGDLIVALPVGDTTAISNMVKSPAISDDVNGDGFASIGDEITYTFIIKNANFEPLTLDILSDPLDGLGVINCNGTTENGEIFTGIGSTDTVSSQDTLLCTASLIVDSDDRAFGQINNTASLTATAPNTFEGANTSASATVTVPNFQLVIEKVTTNSSGSFTFDILNGDPDQLVLTTTVAGETVVSAPIFVDELGVDVIITETPDPSFALVSVECFDADDTAISITQTDTSITIAGADVAVGSVDTASPITCTFTNDVALDIAIQKIPSVSIVEVGDSFSYTIIVTNLSTITAPAVTVEDILIDELDFESTVGCVEDPSGNPICSLGDILPGESASFELNVSLNAAPASGLVENTATASTTGVEVDTVNNVDSAVIQVLFSVPLMSNYGLLTLLMLIALLGIVALRSQRI